MEVKIESRCILTLDIESKKRAKIVSTDFRLEVSDNLDEAQYLDEEGLPNQFGTKALTKCFVQGLIGNIHLANQKNYWNDAEHLRYIISELERGFVQIAEVSIGEM